MTTVQIASHDYQIYLLFNWIATPNQEEDVNDYVAEFLSEQIGFENAEEEINKLLTHPTFWVLQKLYEAKNFDLKSYLKSMVDFAKDQCE